MRNGLETFEANWSSNQTYMTSFAGNQIQDAGFDMLAFGTFNLATNTYTPILDTLSHPVKYTLPESGQQLIVYVQTQTGAGTTPTILDINYINQSGALRFVLMEITEGLPPGRAFYVPLESPDTGVLEIASVTIVSGPARSGVVGIKAPSLVIEDFQTNWGPADVGL